MIQDLLPDDADHFEGLLRGDRVDDHVAVDTDEVFGVEDGVFVLEFVVRVCVGMTYCPRSASLTKCAQIFVVTHLTCCVYDFCCEILALVADDFGEGVLDRWVVALHKVAVDIANREGGFACARRALCQYMHGF